MTPPNKKTAGQRSSQSNSIQWRVILGLILIWVATLYNWQWLWGILFLIWVVPDILSGVTYFMEPVDRQSSPVLYWLIVVSWVVMSGYMIASAFWPQLMS